MAPASAKGKIFRETVVPRKRRAVPELSPVTEQPPPAVMKVGLLCGSDQRCSPPWMHLLRAVTAAPNCQAVLLSSSCPDAELQVSCRAENKEKVYVQRRLRSGEPVENPQ